MIEILEKSFYISNYYYRMYKKLLQKKMHNFKLEDPNQSTIFLLHLYICLIQLILQKIFY